jgi:hypothetical protein
MLVIVLAVRIEKLKDGFSACRRQVVDLCEIGAAGSKSLVDQISTEIHPQTLWHRGSDQELKRKEDRTFRFHQELLVRGRQQILPVFPGWSRL